MNDTGLTNEASAQETCRCLVAEAARGNASAAAIASPGFTLSYGGYHASISLTCERLRAAGVRRGDIAGIVSPASVECLILLMALFRLGAAACPVVPRWPATVMEDRLRRGSCRWVIGPNPPSGATPLHIEDIVQLKSINDFSGEVPLIPANVPATIVFTSGSTGTPKAAVLSYENHRFSAAASNANIPLLPGGNWLLSLSLHHVAGLSVMFRCAAAGATVAVPDPDESIENAIRRAGITHISLVPTQLYRLLNSPGGCEALAGLKAILIGGGPAPETLVRKAAEVALPIFFSYGLSEMASQVTTTRPGDSLEHLLTSGAPIAPNTVRIAHDGEIQVRSGALFLGYLSPEGIQRPQTPDGWFPTGDLGSMDEEGYLSVLGRKDNMFVCGGENVHPEEVERQIRLIPGVRAALVVPIPDERYGMVPVAFIATDCDCAPQETALMQSLAALLPRHQLPRHFLPWPCDIEPGAPKINRSALSSLAKSQLRDA